MVKTPWTILPSDKKARLPERRLNIFLSIYDGRYCGGAYFWDKIQATGQGRLICFKQDVLSMKKLLIFFAAGCLGALLNSLAVWLFGDIGLTKKFSVAIAPSLSAAWLYPRIVWGGIWGWLFFLPILNSKPIRKGSLLSLFPTAVQLFIIFPFKANKGIAGLALGQLTPAFVVFFNWIWGVTTALAIKFSK